MSDPNARHKLRRKYILEQLKLRHSITHQEINDHFKENWTAGNFLSDFELFVELGLPVEHPQGESRFRSTDPQVWPFEVREKEAVDAKAAIAKYVSDLVSMPAGFASIVDCLDKSGSGRTQIKDLIDKINSLRDKQNSRNAAIKTLTEAANFQGRNPAIVRAFLQDWPTKRERHICLDAGTTTQRIAEELATISCSHLSTVRVLTNSPRIERILERPSCPIEVISLGGHLRKNTLAHSGILADQCLASWNHFHIDIALIGTTSFIFDERSRPIAFACDSDAEARIKSGFLNMAHMKWIVFDSRKTERKYSSSFAFAEVLGTDVQAVITNEDIHPETERHFTERGVAVLKAPTV